MNFQRAPTGFRIGASVGIIVLMLGVAIALSISAMSAIGDQIKAVTGFTVPLEKSELRMASIQKSKEDALNSAERSLSAGDTAGLQAAERSFFLYDGQLANEMNNAKDLATLGSNSFAQNILSPDPGSIVEGVNALEKLNSGYDRAATGLFSLQALSASAGSDTITNDLKAKEATIDDKQASMLAYVESSYNNVENNVSDAKQKFLTLEIIITVSAGIISLASGYFVNQINKDLTKEVVRKTRSLQKANEKLRNLNILKDEFISEASHELKSPLNPIYGFVELAKCGDMDKEEALAGIAKQARQIEEVANKILDIGRIDGNRFRISIEGFDLNDLIAEMLEGVRTNLPDGVALESNLSGSIDVEADKVRISQVIRNILGNATKFTQEGRIYVSSSRNGEFASVTISDTGLGIHPEILPTMFDKFATKSHRKANVDGSGLGLYLCKGIIEAHGGSIHAWNNDGQGATVSFSIPLRQRTDSLSETLLN